MPNIFQHALTLRRAASTAKSGPVRRILDALADQVEADTLDPFLRQVKTARVVELLLECDSMPDDPACVDFKHLAQAGFDALSFPFAKEALLDVSRSIVEPTEAQVPLDVESIPLMAAT